jgi:hypothetical protein
MWSAAAQNQRTALEDRPVSPARKAKAPPEPHDEPQDDGVIDGDATVTCPHCGESVVIALDQGSGEHQEYVEDCEVCCRPWLVKVFYHDTGHAEVTVAPLNE